MSPTPPVDSNGAELKLKLNKIYEDFENRKPPPTFNKYEQNYNQGLYDGQLKACEIITNELFGIDGDELRKANK